MKAILVTEFGGPEVMKLSDVPIPTIGSKHIAMIEKGETVLIHSAAGGVGTTVIQFAKILGAGLVIGTVGTQSKKKVALASGADHVICYEQQIKELD